MLARYLSVAAIAFLSLGASANAERAEHLAAALATSAEAPVANDMIVFDHPEAVQPGRRPIGQALSLVSDFLAERSEFPVPTTLPRVKFASSAEIAAARYRDLLAEPELLTFSFSNRANALDMVYDDKRGVLYLSEFWSGGSPAEFSALVHGVVNHAQREAGLTYACAQEREEVAYAARDAWLKLFGQSVQATLGFDKASYMLATQCLP